MSGDLVRMNRLEAIQPPKLDAWGPALSISALVLSTSAGRSLIAAIGDIAAGWHGCGGAHGRAVLIQVHLVLIILILFFVL